ncbi:MAG: RNA-directed DNA polymerase [Planctomycetota bacterium]
MRTYSWFVHLDIRSYFPSIHPEVVFGPLTRFVEDDRLLALVKDILERGRGLYDSACARSHARLSADWPPLGIGLPTGAATSQVFAAHLVLQRLDHRIKRELRVPGYLRYVDDFFLFGRARCELESWREEIWRYLELRLALRLKNPQTRVRSCRGTLDGLGIRITPAGLEPLPRSWRRHSARVGAYVRGGHGPSKLERSLSGAAGLLYFS